MDFNINFQTLMTSQGLAGAVAILVYLITNFLKTNDSLSSRVLDIIKLISAIVLSYVAFYVTGNLTTPDSYIIAFVQAIESQWLATGAFEQIKNLKQKR